MVKESARAYFEHWPIFSNFDKNISYQMDK